MKLLLAILLSLIVVITTSAQLTFSKIFDLDPITQYNSANELKLFDNKIILSSTTFRKSGSNLLDATNLTILNQDGIILDTETIDSFSTLNRTENISILASNTIVSGNIYPDTNLSSILELDGELNKISTTQLVGIPNMHYNNYGFLIVDDYMYLYGILIPTNIVKSSSEARLVKLNYKSKQIIWEKSYKLGNYNLECNDLQPTSDNNLAFILFFTPVAGAGQGEPTYKIIKIDPDGIVLDSFQYMDSNLQKNRLLSSHEGSFYFSSEMHPINGWDWSTSGRINKLDSAMDKLEWSLILPNNQLTDGRMYRIEDYIEARNGDIVVCGRVRENSDSKVPGGDLSTTWNGFIVRVSSEGKIIWLRIYRMPQELLDKTQYGPFRPSNLKKIIELESGDFIAFGDLFYNNLQASGIDPKKDETNHLWLIRVNALGCLGGYPCDTIIRIKPSVPFEALQFHIGDKWTFEAEEPSGNPRRPYIRYLADQIIDTVNLNGQILFVFARGDTMYLENGKMFFWDTKLKSFEMYFDFNSTFNYEIKYWDISRNNVQIAKVKVDSVYNTIINMDTIPTQLLRISNNGTYSQDLVIPIYKNIGASSSEIKLHLGYGLLDPPTLITKLRCFNSNSKEINFQLYPCDSTWLFTNTMDFKDRDIVISPNPTYCNLRIYGIDFDVPYTLFNLQGKCILKGNSNDGEIEIPFSGIFILKIKLSDEYYIKKISRL
ncbi:MAG: T9SS type A sorting domain-containing protein [Saprospiraceae bacterium]